MSTVLRIEHLAKRYTIGKESAVRGRTFRDAITDSTKNAVRFARHPFSSRGESKNNTDDFWALHDVSFDVGAGERLGIIGRNGAGKSTLLKVISRITPPTKGRITIHGRVASLLEVGTGFHPELSGRENIFLNGAILGMNKAEIKSKFDEIVAFAEVERFLDTPVKRYSSGMYVRLAFSVAAHLEPEILIVDEVLAVGDIQFQKKCLGKMEDVSKEGRTVLFVSHNMASLTTLTSRCILLDAGKVVSDGPSPEIISRYQNSFNEEALGQSNLSEAKHYGNGKGRFRSIEMKSFLDGRESAVSTIGNDFEFEVVLVATQDFQYANVGLTLYDELGARLVDASTIMKGDSLSLKAGDCATVKFRLKNLLLNAGLYTAGLWLGIANQEDIDGVRYATSFRIDSRRDDIKYSPPFPSPYVCEFHHEIRAGIKS